MSDYVLGSGLIQLAIKRIRVLSILGGAALLLKISIYRDTVTQRLQIKRKDGHEDQ